MQKVDEPDRLVFRRFEQDRTRSIAKDDAGRAIGVVDDRRHHVGADHQHFLVRSGRDELRSSLQRVNKRRTSRRDIESPDILRAEFVLHQTSGRGKKHVGRNGPHDNRIEIGRLDAALGERFLRRLDRQIAGRNSLVHDVTFANADALHDPLIVGIDHLFEVGVGEKAGWNVGAESADLNALKLAQ